MHTTDIHHTMSSQMRKALQYIILSIYNWFLCILQPKAELPSPFDTIFTTGTYAFQCKCLHNKGANKGSTNRVPQASI